MKTLNIKKRSAAIFLLLVSIGGILTIHVNSVFAAPSLSEIQSEETIFNNDAQAAQGVLTTYQSVSNIGDVRMNENYVIGYLNIAESDGGEILSDIQSLAQTNASLNSVVTALTTAQATLSSDQQSFSDCSLLLHNCNSRASQVQSDLTAYTNSAIAAAKAGVAAIQGNSNQLQTQIGSSTQAASQVGATPQPGSCSVTKFDVYNCLTYVTGWLANEMLIVCGYILGIAAYILNQAISWTILSMATFVTSATGINVGWQLIRDVINLSLIFLLLYAAIKTILGLADGQTRRIIVNIIIFSILVNFSLFFTKIIIDASNILAAGFFSLSVGNGAGVADFAGQFMTKLGLAGIWAGSQTLAGQQFTNILLIGSAGSVMLILSAITFLVAAVLFIVRFVVLIILLILSPIGYIGNLLPGLRRYASQWWKTLIAQCMFAPIYMILIYLVLVLAQNLATVRGTNGVSLADALNPVNLATAQNLNSSNIIINFIIIIGFMNMATIIATQVASGAGGFTAKVADWGKKTVNKTRQGLVQAPIRGTVGNTARIIDDKLAGTAVGNSRFGRGVRSISTESLAKQKFGTSQSSVDIAKSNKSAREQYAKKIETKATKTGNANADEIKTVDGLRAEQVKTQSTLITDLNSKLASAETELTNKTGTQSQVQTINDSKVVIQTETAALAAATTPADRAAIQDRINRHAKNLDNATKERERLIKNMVAADPSVRTLKEQRDSYESSLESVQKKKDETLGRMGKEATGEERKEIVNQALRETAAREKKWQRGWKAAIIGGAAVAAAPAAVSLGVAGTVAAVPIAAAAYLGYSLIHSGGFASDARKEAIKNLSKKAKEGKSAKEKLEELLKETGISEPAGGGAATAGGSTP